MTEVDVTNKRYLAEAVAWTCFARKVLCRPTTLFKKGLIHRFSSMNYLKLFRTAFFKVYLWTASSDLFEYLDTLTINYDLAKFLKILTITIRFVENINFFPRAIFKDLSYGERWAGDEVEKIFYKLSQLCNNLKTVFSAWKSLALQFVNIYSLQVSWN